MDKNVSLLDDIVEISLDAGSKILEVYNTDFSVEHKEDKSPLTAADMAAHHAIVDGLNRLTPEIPVLSEESANIPYETRRAWQTYWLVDPLDGTREFVKRNGEFTVNIALIEGNRSTLGVVYAPVLDVTYAALENDGAWKQQGEGTREPIQARKFPAAMPTVAGSRSHRGDTLNNFLQRLGEHELLSMGSSLKMCLVAEGRADVYPRFGPTSEWDTAAAQAIVETAGGHLVTLDMKPLRYNTKDSLLNPKFMAVGDLDYDWSALL
jgi:3'(2'), 5'-bisphosphate nucleotidase